MIVVRFKVKYKPEKSEQLRTAFVAVVGVSRYVAGVLNFDIARDLTDQLCEATGGPCVYIGRDMKTSHAGMGITEEE